MNYKISLSDCIEFIAGDKTILREIIHPDKKDLKIRYSLAWFKVSAKQKTAKHSLKSSEIYYILSGHGRMSIDDKEFDVKTNDTIYIPPNAIQCIQNLSEKEEIIALCVVDPAWKKEDETIYE